MILGYILVRKPLNHCCMSLKHLPFFAIVLMIFTACELKTPIEPLYEAYIGQWESDVYVIEILPNGGATFDSNQRWDNPRIEGSVKFKEDKIIFLGLDEDGGRKSLRIDREPALHFDPVLGEVMRMTLDGVELIRQ